jgi:dCTP deaminase
VILTRTVILKEIKNGNIVITPFNKKLLGSASYDLALGDTIRIFTARSHPFDVHDNSNYSELTKPIRLTKKGYIMDPGEVILGITNENIKLASNIAGWLEGRSRFARMGLMVHISSPFMSPGIDSHQVLEIANLSPTPLIIYPKTKICQFIFEYCEGNAFYDGVFSKQKKI